jgi:hypothetical protein
MKQLCLGVVVAACLTFPAFGQSTLREQLVGAWALVSCDPKSPVFASSICGTNPNGILIYDASGPYAWIVAARGRAKPSAGRNSPAEELKPLVVGLVAQFGTWSIDETDKTITGHIDGALFPGAEGTESPPVTVSLSGDELRIDGQNVYRRIKK